MHNTRYLYNINPQELTDLSYPNALTHKLNSGKQLLHTLMEVPFQTRDDERVSAVHKAIKHTMYLINELKET